MRPIARVGDIVQGGIHCHGHPHPPLPTPGPLVRGATKTFVAGMPAVRADDQGHSPVCCGGIGRIVVQASQSKVFIEGKAAAGVGTPTMHCDLAPGWIQTGCAKVMIP